MLKLTTKQGTTFVMLSQEPIGKEKSIQQMFVRLIIVWGITNLSVNP